MKKKIIKTEHNNFTDLYNGMVFRLQTILKIYKEKEWKYDTDKGKRDYQNLLSELEYLQEYAELTKDYICKVCTGNKE